LNRLLIRKGLVHGRGVNVLRKKPINQGLRINRMLEDQYKIKSTTPSDINEHLPTLRKLAEECTHVTEAGVRSVVSSYAFATALKGKPDHILVQVDLVKSSNVIQFESECKTEGVNTIFYEESDLTCPLADTDLLFIDTWHCYGHLKRELARWHSYAKKYIVMHDTTVDEWLGQAVRCNENAVIQSKESGIPVDEITRGLWPAIDEFLKDRPEWLLEKRYTNNNGLTILKRVSINSRIPSVNPRPPVLTVHHPYAQPIIDFLLKEESPERTLPVVIGINTVTEPVILYNAEQMTRAGELANLLKTVTNPLVKEVWDYSAENCKILATKGIVARHVPLISPALYVQQIKDLRKNIVYDVGFSGCINGSIVCRRQAIMNKMRDAGLSVHFVNKFGLERDKELAKCYVILNVHYAEDYKIFEQVRCDVWLRAGVPVISETSLDDDPRCINVPYDSIVDTTVNVLKALRPRQPANTKGSLLKDDPIIVIAPNSGFCNRLDFMSKAVKYAKTMNRPIYHVWNGNFHKRYFAHEQVISDRPLEYFFDSSIPCLPTTRPDVNICYSFWKPGDFWFQYQSDGSTQLKITNIRHSSTIPKEPSNESFLIQGGVDVEITPQEQHEIYKTHFKPSAFFRNQIIPFKEPTIGVHIRKVDFCCYFPDAFVSDEKIYAWLTQFTKPVIVFSDDKEFQTKARRQLKHSVTCSFEATMHAPEDQAFLEFLALSNCSHIYGTKRSSFSKQAAIYGNTKYTEITTEVLILPPKPTTVVLGIVYVKGSRVMDVLAGLLKQTANKQAIHIVLLSTIDVSEFTTFQLLNQREYASLTYYVGDRPYEHLLDTAIKMGSSMMIMQANHLLESHTLQTLLDSRDKGVIAPMLLSKTRYSNYHAKVDANGYCLDDPMYDDLLYKRVKGQIAVPVVNGIYFVHHTLLGSISYTDGTKRDSYVIMSDMLRKKGIPQYLDNRREYGTII